MHFSAIGGGAAGGIGGTSSTSENSKLRNANPSQYVKLNVGGSLHYTTIGTLTKHDNMLRAMFSGRMEVLTDSEKRQVYDRHGLQGLKEGGGGGGGKSKANI